MPPKKMTVYLVSGGRFHDIDFARLEILKLLAEHHEIRTKTGNDYSDIANITAADILVTYTCDVQPTPAQTAALRKWVEDGGQWFALHGTNSVLRFLENGLCGCPKAEAPEFFELMGSMFKAHPPIEPFRVDIADPEHPLVKGIEAFDTIDEQYLVETYAEMHTLLETRFKGEATGFEDTHWEESVHPVFYIRTYGKGEVLYLTLGHCRGHYDLQPLADFNPIIERCSWNMPVFYELLRRGIKWSMAKIA